MSYKIKTAVQSILKYEMRDFEKQDQTAFWDAFFRMKDDNEHQTKEYLEDLIKTYGFRSAPQTDSRIKKVIELIRNPYITVLTHIYNIDGKNMHLIGFKCYIEDDTLRVEEFRVNRNTIDKLLLKSVGYGIEEELGGVEEVKNYFNSIHETQFITYSDAVDVVLKELSNRFKKIEKELINDRKSYVFISLDELTDFYYPPFKDDMKLIRTLDNRHESPLLCKYLLHNVEAAKGAKEISLKSHYGSYTEAFPVNEKQWMVINGTQQSEILAVSGPPGTGKTTLLKEIIAELSVKRSKRLIEVWKNDWTLWRTKAKSGHGVYSSPFKGENFESVIVTSTNNEAVNNIGVEITKDIRELRKKLDLKLDTDFSAKLGNKENRMTFYDESLSDLIKHLDEFDQEIDVSAEIEEFERNMNEIDKANHCIEAFLKQRKILDNFDFLLYEDETLAIEKMQQ